MEDGRGKCCLTAVERTAALPRCEGTTLRVSGFRPDEATELLSSVTQLRSDYLQGGLMEAAAHARTPQ